MIVGIDIGTQSLKVVVTDDGFRPLGSAVSTYRASFPRPGWAEQDPGLWERALRPTIGEALEQAGITPQDVKAIGISGQLDGCIAIDRQGRALAPCVIWMDRRAEAEIQGIPGERVRESTGLTLDSTHMAAKIRWLKRHLSGDVFRFHQPVSYMVARLTGAHIFDHALASTTMLYSLKERHFDPILLEAFAIEIDELPELADAEALAGTLSAAGAELTGLARNTPVAVGTGDDFSSPLGAGLMHPGRVACGLGTAEVVGALHPEPTIDRQGLVETHAYANGLYFIENPGWLSGGALTWFVDSFGLTDVAELDRRAEGVAPGADGVLFLPALSGAMAPEWIAGARGCFYGLTPAHGTEHLARATLEGCGFAMRDVIERLDEMGVATDALLLLGGGAQSRLWAEIRADMTARPVERPAETRTSPIGAAMLAAVAAGIQPDLSTAVGLAEGALDVIEPEPARKEAYDDAYRNYRRLFDSLRPMFGED
jgi:xylulokinase